MDFNTPMIAERQLEACNSTTQSLSSSSIREGNSDSSNTSSNNSSSSNISSSNISSSNISSSSIHGNVRTSQKKDNNFTRSKSHEPTYQYPPELSNPELYIVEFDGPNDPRYAQNWPMKKRYLTTIMLTFSTFTAVFTSTIYSTATSLVADEFEVPLQIGVLGLSLYVLGFALGPIIWAPLSELKGRRVTLVWPMLGFSIFQLGAAASKDVQTILICRLCGGIFGAAPITVVTAVFADIYDNRTRGMAMITFATVVFVGPLIAPFIGGFIVQSKLGWRWTLWLASILGFASFFLNLFFLDESYSPIILAKEATKIRLKTKNWAIHAKQEEIEIDLRQLFLVYFSRPLRMLFTEPIILLISLYMAFIYGILYLFLTAYTLVFEGVHSMPPGISGLPYIGMVFGMFSACMFLLLTQPSYNRKLVKSGNVNVPEWRLLPMVVGGVAFATGLFWFGWSGYTASIHWIVPTLSGIFTGFGILTIFIQSINYLVDAYLIYAASTSAASSLLRSLAGASFPLFAPALFRNLGINWGCTLLGCAAVVLVPIPVIFYRYGSRIRERSSFNPGLVKFK